MARSAAPYLPYRKFLQMLSDTKVIVRWRIDGKGRIYARRGYSNDRVWDPVTAVYLLGALASPSERVGEVDAHGYAGKALGLRPRTAASISAAMHNVGYPKTRRDLLRATGLTERSPSPAKS
jgi:hypothetical protein